MMTESVASLYIYIHITLRNDQDSDWGVVDIWLVNVYHLMGDNHGGLAKWYKYDAVVLGIVPPCLWYLTALYMIHCQWHRHWYPIQKIMAKKWLLRIFCVVTKTVTIVCCLEETTYIAAAENNIQPMFVSPKKCYSVHKTFKWWNPDSPIFSAENAWKIFR